MNKTKLFRLLDQYFENTINEVECDELLAYLTQTAPEEIDKYLDSYFNTHQDAGPSMKED